jgi:signal transduction histidine kinase
MTEAEICMAQKALESCIYEHAANVISNNQDMIAARLATLSMMEDAVEAKNALEATNRKLVAEIKEHERSELVQRVLFAISDAVLVTRDIEELISIIQIELGKLLDTRNFYIAFYDEANDTLSAPFVQDEKDVMNTWPASKSLTGYVVKNRKYLMVNKDDIFELIRLGKIEMIGTPSAIWLGVPLEVEDRMIGAFVVQNYEDANAYDAKDLDLLRFISHQISISIQRKKAVQDLKTALAKAEEGDRLKTAFLQNVSHEIRTPMNAILGFSELLNEQDVEPDTRLIYTEIIHKSGNQLMTILEDIINISELEAGKEVLRLENININPLLRDIYEQFRIKVAAKNIELKISTGLEDKKDFIIIDETKLIQIITNLLNNSLKFTRHGSIIFGYKLKNGNLEFFVADTGVGIPEDKFQDIFDRFKQVEIVLSTENGGRGLGLGLSISKAYVELMGGRIWLQSAPGKGSTFHFSIPYAPVIAAENETKQKNKTEHNGAV